jgi:hypothetical protein
LFTSLALGQGAASLDAFDKAWPDRDKPEVLQSLKAQSDAAIKAHPDDFEAMWRAARLTWWEADGQKDTERKKALGKEAWALGDKASKLNPKAVQGFLYAALGIGAYSQGAGVVHALTEGLESKFNERLDTANKMDPNWLNGAGPVAKGRYWYELPWPKRNLSKAKEVLAKVIAAHPENLRAYVYLAEAQLADGDAKAASATLKKAQEGDVSYDPPEGRRVKEMAAVAAVKIQKELK